MNTSGVPPAQLLDESVAVDVFTLNARGPPGRPSRYGRAHVSPVLKQLPAEQTWPAGQTLRHPPQFNGSFCTFTHTPLHGVPESGQLGTPTQLELEHT